MKFLILRKYLEDRTEGHLTINDTDLICDTLERSITDPTHPCIPEGIFELELYFSPANHMEVPLVKNVPNRSMIEMHSANHVSELLGCIAPGEKKDNLVINSRDTFKKLMILFKKAIANNEYIELEIKKQ